VNKIVFLAVTALILLNFTGLAGASHLLVTDPVKSTVEPNGETDLGVVGPGQKLELVLMRETGEDAVGITYKSEALWDKLYVSRDTLPIGWSAEDAKFYEQPMHAFVTVAADAEDGEYFFKILAIDEYEGTPALEATAKVRVSRELLDVSLEQKTISVGVDQPALFYLRLRNKSSASDAVAVSVHGLPGAELTQKTFLRHNSETVLPIELSEKERGEYGVTFRAESVSSALIFKEDRGTLVVLSSIWNDALAVANGILLFPSAEQSIYAGIGLIARLLS